MAELSTVPRTGPNAQVSLATPTSAGRQPPVGQYLCLSQKLVNVRLAGQIPLGKRI